MIRTLRRQHRVWAVVLLLGGLLGLSIAALVRPAPPAPTSLEPLAPTSR